MALVRDKKIAEALLVLCLAYYVMKRIIVTLRGCEEKYGRSQVDHPDASIVAAAVGEKHILIWSYID